jgi:DNA-binding NtrC family response regulator
MPPLRERREDIPVLAERYLTEATTRIGATRPSLSAGALEALVAHEWPGNDAELEAVLTRAALLATGGEAIDVEHLGLGIPATAGAMATGASSPTVSSASSAPTSSTASSDPTSRNASSPSTSSISEGLLAHSLKDAKRLVIDHFEHDYLSAHLRATRGRVGATAERAGITPRALYEKMRALGLRKEDFRR